MQAERVQVAIIGAGPAGLLLAELLALAGIETIILEQKSRAYVEARIRAGVLEQGTVGLLDKVGAGSRLHAQGLVHTGSRIVVDGRMQRIDFQALTGKTVVVYGQTEITKDLVAARLAAGRRIVFEAEAVAIHDADSERPYLTYTHDGQPRRIDCDIIGGCDGFHGVSRAAIPAGQLKTYERVYPFGWLGILSPVPPCLHEVVYARHARGFALASMRSPTLSRYYLQCDPGTDLAAWPDERIWDELKIRLGPEAAAGMTTGPLVEKGISPLRSFVAAPMRFGRLFLAGDSAHIVPPTGAKGLNLAASDAHYLAEAIAAFYRTGTRDGLDGYSDLALKRVWKAERFSWWITSLMHNFHAPESFETQMQTAELDYLLSSRAAQTALAENYVGLAF